MCQIGDTKFIELLKNIRVGNVDSYAEDILKTCFLQQPGKLYPYDALYIHEKNDPANRYHECMLNSFPNRVISIPVKDAISKNCSMLDVLQAQNRKHSHNGSLNMLLNVKVNARVMVTTNFDFSDRPVEYFAINQNEVETIYVAIDDFVAFDAINKKWVPIKKE